MSLSIYNTREQGEKAMRLVLDRALDVATTSKAAPKTSFNVTTRRTLTRRGVIWLGQTCNLHCQFCYFIDRIKSPSHPEHSFMSLEKAKKICKTLVKVYGNNAVDIQGGEPTIFRGIFDLIHYCNEIGLRPTLITNALMLDDINVCRRYKETGIRDFLISVHGLGEVYDKLVGRGGAHLRQMKALHNLQEVGIPFRFNCVLAKPVVKQLPFISELAIRTGALVVNFIAFNPFEDQSQGGKRSSLNVPRYSEVRAELTEALDILYDAGIEVNVRYFPFCMVEDRHRKSVYNFQQLPYDHHEWDYGSWAWTALQPQRMKEGDVSDPVRLSSSRMLVHLKRPLKRLANISALRPILYKAHKLVSGTFSNLKTRDALYRDVARLHAEVHCRYVHAVVCNRCAIRDICDGFHGDYADIFGVDEAIPVAAEKKIDDPLHYIQHQQKIVEREDEEWAL